MKTDSSRKGYFVNRLRLLLMCQVSVALTQYHEKLLSSEFTWTLDKKENTERTEQEPTQYNVCDGWVFLSNFFFLPLSGFNVVFHHFHNTD